MSWFFKKFYILCPTLVRFQLINFFISSSLITVLNYDIVDSLFLSSTVPGTDPRVVLWSYKNYTFSSIDLVNGFFFAF